MATWPPQPIIYETNTWTWLHDLTQRTGRPISLGSVPPEEWDALAAWRFHAIWLMGVWERSPAGTRIARQHPALQAEYRRSLPDLSLEDIAGSPYCIHRYVVDPHLGGPEGLAAARRELARRGLRLVLDFVPNHVAPDHPWVSQHPDYFIQGSAEDLSRAPGEFFQAGGRIFACGRDPYFAPWTDTAQLNAFHPGLRRAASETLCGIAEQCDGVRCDMAMLLITRVFERTWGPRAGNPLLTEYWREVIGAARARHPGFLFMAEAYWDLEWELQQQGFDYCYDKRLHDRLLHDTAENVRLHLLADLAYQEKLVRFMENHDEPRAAATFPPAKARAAAITMATLPGAKLFHEGQFEGWRVKLPVQLGRRPLEPIDADLQDFYRKLLRAISGEAFREGGWRLCERTGWPDNSSFLHLLAWGWRQADERCLIVVNLSDVAAQGRVRVPWEDVAGGPWRLADIFSGAVYLRDGDEMRDPGLYVDLGPWGFHLLDSKPASTSRP